MNRQLKLGIVVFLLGFVGVLTSLTMEIPMPEEMLEEVNKVLTPIEFKLLMLLNPTILLLAGVALGTLMHQKAGLSLPVIKSWVGFESQFSWKTILSSGILGGVLAGVGISLASMIFIPFLPMEFIQINEEFEPGIWVKLLYGGITEEILVRFGLMTLLVFLGRSIFKNAGQPIMWTAIIISAIAFGFGHLPLVFTMLGTITPMLFFYIILGNTLGGIIFGWLYWKKGLESAMIAHMVTHLVMILLASFM